MPMYTLYPLLGVHELIFELGIERSSQTLNLLKEREIFSCNHFTRVETPHWIGNSIFEHVAKQALIGRVTPLGRVKWFQEGISLSKGTLV